LVWGGFRTNGLVRASFYLCGHGEPLLYGDTKKIFRANSLLSEFDRERRKEKRYLEVVRDNTKRTLL